MVEREQGRLERIEEQRRTADDLVRRLAGLDQSVRSLETTVSDLASRTRTHLVAATCINGGAKVLQGASAGGGVIGGAIAVVYLLKQLGFL